MEHDFSLRKQAYLEQLEESYKPKRKKWWHSNTEIYYDPAAFSCESKLQPNANSVYEFFLEKPYSEVIGAVAAGAFLFLADNEAARIFSAVFLLLILYRVFIGYFDKRVKLKFDKQAIHFNNMQSTISWESIVLLYVHKSYDDTLTHELLIHYYDAVSNQFYKKVIRLDELDKKVPDICFAIEQCKNAVSSGY